MESDFLLAVPRLFLCVRLCAVVALRFSVRIHLIMFDRTLIETYAAGGKALRESVQGLSQEQLTAFPIAGTWSTQQRQITRTQPRARTRMAWG